MILAGVGRLLFKKAEGFGRQDRPAVLFGYALLVGRDVTCEMKVLCPCQLGVFPHVQPSLSKPVLISAC